MRGTRILKSFIQETKNRIKECEEHKRKLHAHSNQLKKLWLEAKISYSEYEKRWGKKHKGKTIKEWFEFYDNHIKECENKI